MWAVRMLAACALIVGGCGPTTTNLDGDRRGATNGRMFDLISSKPDGTEWTVRLRGDALWVAYSTVKDARDLGPVTLTGKESRALWSLVEQLDLFERDEGELDEEAGTVMLRLREPVEDGEHALITTYVSRDTDDEDVIALANYLIDLIGRHHEIEPAL